VLAGGGFRQDGLAIVRAADIGDELVQLHHRRGVGKAVRIGDQRGDLGESIGLVEGEREVAVTVDDAIAQRPLGRAVAAVGHRVLALAGGPAAGLVLPPIVGGNRVVSDLAVAIALFSCGLG
jgi:hypothetical protein